MIRYCPVIIAGFLLGIISCKKLLTELVNQAPVADAGSEQYIKLPLDSILLSGTGTDADGQIVSYSWKKTLGPAAYLIRNPNSGSTIVSMLQGGVYEFELTVTDDKGLTGKDRVLVYVTAPYSNDAPVARAGPDQQIVLKSCNDASGVFELDGSGSTDPDSNIVTYRWNYVYGGRHEIINSFSPRATVRNISLGTYAFELIVSDYDGLSSRDTVLIHVTSAQLPAEYDLDMTFTGNYLFFDNYNSCSYYPYPPCDVYDYTELNGAGNYPPLGRFGIQVSESADTAFLSNQVYGGGALLHIYTPDGSKPALGSGTSAYGICTVNFKKLIREGGGSFEGIFKVEWGSAGVCASQNIYLDLSPLSVNGTLNVLTKTFTLRIRGKTFF